MMNLEKHSVISSLRYGRDPKVLQQAGKSMCIYNQLEHLFNPGEWSSQKREANFSLLEST